MKSGRHIATFQSKSGKSVSVRFLDWTDLDAVNAYGNALSKEDTFVMLSGEELPRSETVEYMTQALRDIESGKKIHLVAHIDGALAAHCEVRREKKRKYHVGEVSISVASGFRQEGLGTKLIGLLIEEAKKLDMKLLWLTCFEMNTHAIHVYEKMGFQKVGVIPKAYSYKGDFANEVVMYMLLA